MVWSLCCRSLFSDITSSFSWLMRMKLSVPPESIDWVMELLMGETEYEACIVCKCLNVSTALNAFPNNYRTHRTCPRWMASSPVLVSSLESPSGLKTIYGCKENQNGPQNSIKMLFSDLYYAVQMWRKVLPLLPQSLLLLRTQAPTQSAKDKLAVIWQDPIFCFSLLHINNLLIA